MSLKIALMYDFDKTLSITDMQEFDFIKRLGLTPKKFWEKVNENTNTNQMDKILSYMYTMIIAAKEKNIDITKEFLAECGRSVILYPGVDTWFERINNYAITLGVEVEHYIISSGVTEMIKGTEIAKYFKKIYASSYIYDENGCAIWPRNAVNYTQKTQYIFRIAKGVLDESKDDEVNKKYETLDIPYNNMIYFGDGITDIPCMGILKARGGHSVAIYREGKEDKILPLINDERITIACSADYSEGGMLEKAVKYMIGNMNSNYLLHKIEEDALNKAKK